MDISFKSGYHYHMPIPPYPVLCDHILKALHEFGGATTSIELENRVGDMLGLSLLERNQIHKDKKTKLKYRIQWARFLLKRKGLLEISKRGTVVLSKKGRTVAQYQAEQASR